MAVSLAASGLLDGAAAGHGLWDRPDRGLPASTGLLKLSSNTAGSYWMVICLLNSHFLSFGGLLLFFSFMSLVPSFNSSYCCLLCFWEFVLLLFLLFVCVLRIMLTHLLFVFRLFLFVFFLSSCFSKPSMLLPQIDLDKVKRRHEAQVIYRQEWSTEDWRECNTRGSETILNHI